MILVTSIKVCFFILDFVYQVCLLVPLNNTSGSNTDGKSEEGSGNRWKQREAIKQRSSLKEEENEKEWKWEEEEERRPSANIHVNWWTSLPTVDYWSEPTLLKTHWTHCTDPHDYSLHWASPFIVNDSLIIWMMWIGLICDMHDIFLKNSCFQL